MTKLLMESGGTSLPRDGEKLVRIAAIAEAVSHQKVGPSSTTTDNIPPVDDNLQSLYDAPLSIADTLKRENAVIRASTLTQTDVASITTTTAANPASRFELPSVMVSIGQAQTLTQALHPSSSSFSRKRSRVEYGLSSEEQRIAPSMIGFDSQTIQQQPQPQPQYQYQYQHQREEPHDPPLRTHSGTAIPQPSFEGVRFREYQAEIWSEKFEELCTFRRFHGHCHVPHHYNQNAGLAQWVKRQRYQYKLKLDSKRSTLSDERVRLLNKIGFIWNSHDAVWEERLQDLIGYKRVHGHCIVPSNFESNPQLAVWTKRQRRQYKKYQDWTSSSMTPERIAKLENIGFVWDCRKISKVEDARGDMQGVGGTAGAAATAAVSSPGTVQWPHTMGVTSGIGNRFKSGNINMNTGTNCMASIAQRSGQILPDPVSRWNDPLLPTPIGRGNDQQLGAYSYQGCSSAVASTSTEGNDDSASQKSPLSSNTTTAVGLSKKDDTESSNSSNNELMLSVKQQAIRKNPRCEFFSFSRKFTRDDEKKPS